MVATRGATWHQGDRSEYLVQYALSAVAAAIPVQRQEDYGVDFFCNLTKKVKDSLHVGPAFGLQCKSDTKDVEYGVYGSGKKKGQLTPEEITWLYAQDNPLFFAIVSREALLLEIFSLARIWRPYWMEGPPKTATLLFRALEIDGPPGDAPYRCTRDPENVPTTVIPLGPPIIRLDLNTDDLEDEDFRSQLRAALDYWIALERRNIANAKLDIPCFYESAAWTTNETPAVDDEVIFQVFNENEGQNVPEVVRAVSPGVTNLAYSFIAQEDLGKLRDLLPMLDLILAHNTPDRPMVDRAAEKARELLAAKEDVADMQWEISTKTGGGTASASGHTGGITP